MSKIQLGEIKKIDLLKKIRGRWPRQTEKAHSSLKGSRGYNRQRQKRQIARDLI